MKRYFQLSKKKFLLIAEGISSAEQDIADEFEGLSAVLISQLTSTYGNLRQVGQSCFFVVARAIVNGDSVSAKQKLIEMTVNLAERFCKKKNSKLTSSFWEEILINRFPDFFIPILLPILVTSCGDVAIPFIRTEICRIIGLIIKKFKSVNEQTKQIISSSIFSLMGSLTQAILQSVGDKKIKELTNIEQKVFSLPAKRVKPIISCVKIVLDFLREKEIKTYYNIKDSLLQLKEIFSANSQSASPVVVKMVQQIQSEANLLLSNIESKNSGGIKSANNNSSSIDSSKKIKQNLTNTSSNKQNGKRKVDNNSSIEDSSKPLKNGKKKL
jgi:hypothetical protein